MKKYKIKEGDKVIVTAGENKGQVGKVLTINKKTDRIIVEGVNMRTKHKKPDSNNPQGGIVKKEAAIHISNTSLIDSKSGKATRIAIELKDNKKVRISKKSKEVI